LLFVHAQIFRLKEGGKRRRKKKKKKKKKPFDLLILQSAFSASASGVASVSAFAIVEFLGCFCFGVCLGVDLPFEIRRKKTKERKKKTKKKLLCLFILHFAFSSSADGAD
jgi:transcription elongation factor Elf1